MKDRDVKDHEGWRVFKITTPDGTNFLLGFKDDTLRIRQRGWIPVEKTVKPDTMTTIGIHYDTGTAENVYQTVPGKHVETEDKDE